MKDLHKGIFLVIVIVVALWISHLSMHHQGQHILPKGLGTK
jgi:hypothetical protein